MQSCSRVPATTCRLWRPTRTPSQLAWACSRAWCSSCQLLILRAQVSFDYLWTFHHVGRLAFGDLGAVIEHHHALGDLHNHLHHVFHATYHAHAPFRQSPYEFR